MSSKKTPPITAANLTVQRFQYFERAYTIALLGGYKLTVVGVPEHQSLIEDYAEIKKAFPDVEYASTGGLIVELAPFYDHTRDWLHSHYETMERIRLEVETARYTTKPTELSPCGTGQKLLNIATTRKGLSTTQVAGIYEVAATIAQLSGPSDIIRAEYVAEALQYHICDEAATVIAESSERTFGPHIKISRLELHQTYIEAAISYLQSRL